MHRAKGGRGQPKSDVRLQRGEGGLEGSDFCDEGEGGSRRPQISMTAHKQDWNVKTGIQNSDLEILSSKFSICHTLRSGGHSQPKEANLSLLYIAALKYF